MPSRLSSTSPGPLPDAADLRQAAQQARARFQPSPPRETRIRLVEVDPMQVHVSWQIHQEDLLRARNTAGASAPLVLRLHDVAYMDFSGANPHATREVPLADNAGSQYFTLAGPTRTLLAEIGLRGDWRELALLARSGVLRLPPAGETGGWLAEHRLDPALTPTPLPGGEGLPRSMGDGFCSPRPTGEGPGVRDVSPPVEPSMALARFPFAAPFDTRAELSRSKLRASFPLVARPGTDWPILPAWRELAGHFPELAALLARDAPWRAPRAEPARAPLSSFALCPPVSGDET